MRRSPRDKDQGTKTLPQYRLELENILLSGVLELYLIASPGVCWRMPQLHA
jgi:hypothetical protein